MSNHAYNDALERMMQIAPSLDIDWVEDDLACVKECDHLDEGVMLVYKVWVFAKADPGTYYVPPSIDITKIEVDLLDFALMDEEGYMLDLDQDFEEELASLLTALIAKSIKTYI